MSFLESLLWAGVAIVIIVVVTVVFIVRCCCRQRNHPTYQPTSQVYVTQQLVPAMQYQPYYPGCAPVQSVHVGQPYLAPPPAYLDASQQMLPSQPYVPPPPQPTEAVQLPYNPAYVPSVLTGSHI